MQILENGDIYLIQEPAHLPVIIFTVKTKNIPVEKYALTVLFLDDENKAVVPLGFSPAVKNGSFEMALCPTNVPNATHGKVVFGAMASDAPALSTLGDFEVLIGGYGEPDTKINGFHDFYGNTLRIGNIKLTGTGWVFEANAGCSENTLQSLIKQHGA